MIPEQKTDEVVRSAVVPGFIFRFCSSRSKLQRERIPSSVSVPPCSKISPAFDLISSAISVPFVREMCESLYFERISKNNLINAFS